MNPKIPYEMDWDSYEECDETLLRHNNDRHPVRFLLRNNSAEVRLPEYQHPAMIIVDLV